MRHDAYARAAAREKGFCTLILGVVPTPFSKEVTTLCVSVTKALFVAPIDIPLNPRTKEKRSASRHLREGDIF